MKLNRRSFIKYFTGGLLGAGLVPMLGESEQLKPMVGSVTDVNGCAVVRIEQGEKVAYFSDVDNIDEKSFTPWADKENLHWDKIVLA